MSVGLKRLADAPQLTAGALAGTERIPADNGTADGYVTAAQIAALASPSGHTHDIVDVTGLEAALEGKLDVGAAAGFADAAALATAQALLGQAVAADSTALRSGVAGSHQIPHAHGLFALYSIAKAPTGPTGQYGIEIYVSNRNGDHVLIATLPNY